jgi:hypothetical protein
MTDYAVTRYRGGSALFLSKKPLGATYELCSVGVATSTSRPREP